jgi:hypothetical protein
MLQIAKQSQSISSTRRHHTAELGQACGSLESPCWSVWHPSSACQPPTVRKPQLKRMLPAGGVTA